MFTFGEKGCVGYSKEGFFVLPAFSVDVVDTVGAGDVFHGAFLAQLLKGQSVMECARAASAVSAIKCTKNWRKSRNSKFGNIAKIFRYWRNRLHGD